MKNSKFIMFQGHFFNVDHVIKITPTFEGVRTSKGGYIPKICFMTTSGSFQILHSNSDVFETTDQAIASAEMTIEDLLEKI